MLSSRVRQIWRMPTTQATRAASQPVACSPRRSNVMQGNGFNGVVSLRLTPWTPVHVRKAAETGAADGPQTDTHTNNARKRARARAHTHTHTHTHTQTHHHNRAVGRAMTRRRMKRLERSSTRCSGRRDGTCARPVRRSRGRRTCPRTLESSSKTNSRLQVAASVMARGSASPLEIVEWEMGARTYLRVRPGRLTIFECRFNKTTHHPQSIERRERGEEESL